MEHISFSENLIAKDFGIGKTKLSLTLEASALAVESACADRGTLVLYATSGRFINQNHALELVSGELTLFRLEGHRRLMEYDLYFTNQGGRYHFRGIKMIHLNRSWFSYLINLWSSTTVVESQLAPEGQNTSAVWQGTLRITPVSFLIQLISFRVRGKSLFRQVTLAGSFLTYFARALFSK